VTGRLYLRRTAEVHWGDTDLVGRVDLDFSAVGAPVDPGQGPDPMSEDPEEPGVLVEDYSLDKYPEGTPALLIGTVSQKNPYGTSPEGYETIRLSTDGGGIGLFVHSITSAGFTGRWSEWGLVYDGRGVFCAPLMPASP
jgi:hypothetical protein